MQSSQISSHRLYESGVAMSLGLSIRKRFHAIILQLLVYQLFFDRQLVTGGGGVWGVNVALSVYLWPKFKDPRSCI